MLIIKVTGFVIYTFPYSILILMQWLEARGCAYQWKRPLYHTTIPYSVMVIGTESIFIRLQSVYPTLSPKPRPLLPSSLYLFARKLRPLLLSKMYLFARKPRPSRPIRISR